MSLSSLSPVFWFGLLSETVQKFLVSLTICMVLRKIQMMINGGNIMWRITSYFFGGLLSLLFLPGLFLSTLAVAVPETPALAVDEQDRIDYGYLPPDQFFALVDDFSVMPLAVQTTPNSPVTSASGLTGVLINLFGSYSPVITQLRYQSNTSTNYTYVNDISPDYPWLCSAGLFTVMIYCLMRIWGAVLCRQ